MNIHVLWCFSLGIIEMATLLLSGWIADQNWIKKYHYHKIYLIFCGITNLLCPLATTFSSLMAYSITFAIFSGGYLALLLPVQVDLVGAPRFHSALGLSSLIAGLGVITGPPIAGKRSNTSLIPFKLFLMHPAKANWIKTVMHLFKKFNQL